jgi:DNA-binding SARP family transcriptional activator
MRFRLLGPTEVEDDGRPLVLGARMQRAVLAVLLLRRGEPISTERLADELWGEATPRAATNTVQQYVSQLRKQLGSQRIETAPGGYALRLARGELDIERFEMLLRAEKIHEALDLWRGNALVDFETEPFAQSEIARLEELRLAALERRIDLDLERGLAAELVGELRALVAASPYREHLRGQLMLALYRSGRQVDALECFQEGRTTLVDELGIEPGPALRALEAAVLRQDPALDAAAREPRPRPERPVLVVSTTTKRLPLLLPTAEALIRQPRRELLVAGLLAAGGDPGAATAALAEHRTRLADAGIDARVVAYGSTDPGADAAVLAAEQNVGLVLVDAPDGLAEDGELGADRLALLAAAPCDVGILTAGDGGVVDGAVVVPFGGLRHEWAAVELAAWIARNREVPLRLAGVPEAGRLLGRASLAVQAAAGVVAEPLLVEPGPDGMAGAVAAASLVVIGLSDAWRETGLGAVRRTVIAASRAPVLLVRRGDRPGGLAPPHTITRFSWTDAAA